MNEQDIRKAVFNEVGDRIDKATCAMIVDSVFEHIVDFLVEYDEVTILGFGSFRVKDISTSHMKNVQTGEPVATDSVKRVLFRPSKKLKDSINHR